MIKRWSKCFVSISVLAVFCVGIIVTPILIHAKGLKIGPIKAIQDKIDQLKEKNTPPDIPLVPKGPSSGKSGVAYTFGTYAMDPDDDQVCYRFDWGDGNISDWTAFVHSGDWAEQVHIFSSTGTYSVKAQAKDSRNAPSGWSEPAQIQITMAKLAEDTKVLTKETVDQLTKQEDQTYYFDKQATEIENLKVEDIIVSTKDEGFLRKVTAINTTATEYIVETTTATLEESFEELKIEIKKTLTPEDINPEKAPRLKKGVHIRKAPKVLPRVPGAFYLELNWV